MPRLAQQIAGAGGRVDAAVIGRAAASLHHNPGDWREWGDYPEALRVLRQLWHVVVHFGDRIEL
jgi:Protein of unknown function (DUF3626)